MSIGPRGLVRACLLWVLLLGMPLSGWAQAVTLENVRFYYRMDAETRYQTLRARWQDAHTESFTAEDAENIAWKAFSESTVDKPLDQWHYHGGPHPGVFFAKAYLRNQSEAAQLEVPLQVTLEAHMGPLRVDPNLLLTDYAYLAQHGRWQTVYTAQVTVPVLAAGEETLLPVSRFELYRFLRFNPTQWPDKLKLKVSVPGSPAVESILELEADHFVLPEAYRY